MNTIKLLMRLAVLCALPSVLAACSASNAAPPLANLRESPEIIARYAALKDEPFEVSAVNLKRFDEKYVRQVVDFATEEHPGTIVVDPKNRFLYLVQDDGTAIRYGVGVGQAGLEFTGAATVQYKRAWPRWTPTSDMIRRNPGLYGPWRHGMQPGARNPLGARALYLFKDGKDTLFRIHGTFEPTTIGQAVSSGCIRMLNHDVIDLARRVPNGSKVVVLGDPQV